MRSPIRPDLNNRPYQVSTSSRLNNVYDDTVIYILQVNLDHWLLCFDQVVDFVDGKESVTHIKVVNYADKMEGLPSSDCLEFSYVKLMPVTGRWFIATICRNLHPDILHVISYDQSKKLIYSNGPTLRKPCRSHQLRVHLAHIGHPILGDTLYAPPAVMSMSSRLCLHAQFLKFVHPGTKEITVVSSKHCDFFPANFVPEGFV